MYKYKYPVIPNMHYTVYVSYSKLTCNWHFVITKNKSLSKKEKVFVSVFEDRELIL